MKFYTHLSDQFGPFHTKDALATVHKHGTCPARSLVATFLVAEEAQMFA